MQFGEHNQSTSDPIGARVPFSQVSIAAAMHKAVGLAIVAKTASAGCHCPAASSADEQHTTHSHNTQSRNTQSHNKQSHNQEPTTSQS